MKICTKCKKNKDLTCFAIDKKKPGGKTSWCCQCNTDKIRNWRHRKRKEDPLFRAKERWKATRTNAKKRKLEWEIPFEEWYELITKNKCHYCESKLSEHSKDYLGLDRIDNNEGYILDNVVPCCMPCNVGRSMYFTQDDWQIMIDALLKHRKI